MKKLTGISIVLTLLFLTACGSGGFQQINNSDPESQVSLEDIPEEPAREELEKQIRNSNNNNIDAVVANNFHMLDIVAGENGNADIYATKRFGIAELGTLLSEAVPPEEISELKDNRQILAYPNHFVSITQSEDNSDLTLIEVASDEFVRNNYSPNYFNGFFTFLLLNRLLDSDGWSKRRLSRCRDSRCYGGYTTYRSQGGSGVNRGMSTYRGGGPSAGK